MAPKKGTGWTLGEEPKIRPRWKDVLLAVYNYKPVGEEWGRGKTSITDDHPLAKRLKISGGELMHSLDFLEEQKLIKYGPERNWINLTEKGFDVAGKIEERRETRLYRLSSLMFSGILALTLVTTLIYQMNLVDPQLLLIAYIITTVLLWAAVLKLSRRKPLREVTRGFRP